MCARARARAHVFVFSSVWLLSWSVLFSIVFTVPDMDSVLSADLGTFTFHVIFYCSIIIIIIIIFMEFVLVHEQVSVHVHCDSIILWGIIIQS